MQELNNVEVQDVNGGVWSNYTDIHGEGPSTLEPWMETMLRENNIGS